MIDGRKEMGKGIDFERGLEENDGSKHENGKPVGERGSTTAWRQD